MRGADDIIQTLIKIIWMALTLLFILLFLTACMKSAESKPTDPKVAIVYSPHADDESLSFGIAIRNYIHKGYEVHVVLLSDGRKSSAIKKINEVSKTSISREKFSRFRVSDFQRACKSLGINKNLQHIYNLENGYFNPTQVQNILLHYENKYPRAVHLSFSEIDMQKDHAVVGKVLNDLYDQKKIHYKQNYVSLATAHYAKLTTPAYTHEKLEDQRDHTYIDHALKVYETWQPQRGLYKTGGFSVPKQFQIAHQEKFNRRSIY